MKKTLSATLVLGALMLSSAGVTKIMTPTIHLSESLPALVLEKAIPVQFGDWQEEKNLASAVVNPQSLELINKIYTQTLSRTYANNKGERIMLSVAYGADQRDGLQMHQPEVCYPAQGFQVLTNDNGVLDTGFGTIRVTRLMTQLGERSEPVTYWSTLGDKVVQGGMDTKLVQLGYGFRGQIPDGLLFRVSSISRMAKDGYDVQSQFVRDFVAALPANTRQRLAGLSG